MYKRELKNPDRRDLIRYSLAPIDPTIATPAADHAGRRVLVAGGAACSPS